MPWPESFATKVEILTPGGRFGWDAFIRRPPEAVCGDAVLQFCEQFSKTLLSEPRCRAYPDLIALGFWFRASNIHKIREACRHSSGVSVGRGMAFHLAPGNVDTLFVYTLCMGLLAGDTNVVRVGKRTTDQQVLLLELLCQVLAGAADVAARVLIVRYGHDDDVTQFFSSQCHARVIWGGDETIAHIRRIPLPAGSTEVTFAGKFSWAVLDAGKWLAEKRADVFASAFVTDVFSFGQQGCSSPKLIVWRGTADLIQAAQQSFWAAVEKEVQHRRFAVLPSESIQRWTAVNAMAAEASAPGFVQLSKDRRSFVRVEVKSWGDVVRRLHTGNGLFYEIGVSSLEEALANCSDAEQTIVSFGVAEDEWRAALAREVPKGVCRIVRLGKALEFDHIWDGFNLVDALSRQIAFRI